MTVIGDRAEARAYGNLVAKDRLFPSSQLRVRRMQSHSPETHAVVLLVESEPVTRTGITAFLHEAGFGVIEAANTIEAWTTLEARPEVQVLFADLDVSGGPDGLELARRVHERWPAIGLVITSGHVRNLSPSAIPGDGCFIPRPLPVDTLLHEVRVAAHRVAARGRNGFSGAEQIGGQRTQVKLRR